MTPRIELSIAPDGVVTAETRDIAGRRCLDYMEVLENLLEATVVDSAFTMDFSRTSSTLKQEGGTKNELGQH